MGLPSSVTRVTARVVVQPTNSPWGGRLWGLMAREVREFRATTCGCVVGVGWGGEGIEVSVHVFAWWLS